MVIINYVSNYIQVARCQEEHQIDLRINWYKLAKKMAQRGADVSARDILFASVSINIAVFKTLAQLFLTYARCIKVLIAYITLWVFG